MLQLSAITVGFLGNLGLAALKISAGTFAHSQALIADGIHSLGDVLSSVAGAIGAKIGSSPPDENHPYGHGNAESFAALFVGIIMAGAGVELLLSASERFQARTLEIPDLAAAGAALLACFAKEGMHRHALREAQRTRSPAVIALAKDHRSDVLSSLAAVFGVLGARKIHPYLDPLASVVISGFVLRMAWEILEENIHILMAGQPDEGPFLEALRKRAGQDKDVRRLNTIRILQVGAALNLEIDLWVDPCMTVFEAHKVAHRVEKYARELEERVQQVQVHVEPADMKACSQD